LSRFTDVDLAAGASLFDTQPSMAPTYYYRVALRHQFNRNLQAFFSSSHDLFLTTGTDLTEVTIFSLGAQANLTRFITFTTNPFYSFGDEKTGPTQGDYKQYGVELALTWRPHRRWQTGITYNFIRRIGNNNTGSYIQNTVAFGVSYRF
jgi:hypothetical protein